MVPISLRFPHPSAVGNVYERVGVKRTTSDNATTTPGLRASLLLVLMDLLGCILFVLLLFLLVCGGP